MAEGEIFRATIISQLDDGTAVVNDFGYFDSSSGSGHIDCGIAAGNFQTMVQAKFQAALTDDLTIMRYRFACVHGAAIGEIGYVETGGGIMGSHTAGDRLPNEIAISIRRNTGHAGRGDRGRIFLGPVASSLVSTNVNKCDPTNSDLTDIANLLKQDLTTQSRVLKPVLVKPDGTSNARVIINVSVGETFVHRRSRRPRVGA